MKHFNLLQPPVVSSRLYKLPLSADLLFDTVHPPSILPFKRLKTLLTFKATSHSRLIIENITSRSKYLTLKFLSSLSLLTLLLLYSCRGKDESIMLWLECLQSSAFCVILNYQKASNDDVSCSTMDSRFYKSKLRF